ncbi:hypothetical protein [Dentiradicibacter hellwigii]|uniref:Uncharacterized protein n=1 Tax=Dentiradicibacter hellwigii TaxID=3149053 RepID=A0ABV4UDM4_9RHOO
MFLERHLGEIIFYKPQLPPFFKHESMTAGGGISNKSIAEGRPEMPNPRGLAGSCSEMPKPEKRS